ncbi:hypothetical protein DV515_00011131 [Chloebia gouldiae]|uniref:Uncharacterized protein n=1 Tax=Chloebia gouldiae TaxID=44316 RepID=A0A3L8S883_CHLGU|nr:hypothetical protein DV515_00011131 [Chloebia gouldiae]
MILVTERGVPCSSQHNYTVILLHRGAVGILSSFITLVQKQSGVRDVEFTPVEPGQPVYQDSIQALLLCCFHGTLCDQAEVKVFLIVKDFISPGMMKSSVHAEEDDFVPELQRSIHPRERPDWEETLSAMGKLVKWCHSKAFPAKARGADIPDIPGELPLRSCGSTASMKVKNVKKLSFTKGHFPKMAECAHFHYENVDFGNIQLATGSSEKFFPGTRSHLWKFQVIWFFPLVKWEEIQCGFCHGRIPSSVEL